MIALVESQTIEFKRIWKNEYLKTICALANIGRDTINEHISRLKKENRVKRVGDRKAGYWEVLDDR